MYDSARNIVELYLGKIAQFYLTFKTGCCVSGRA